MGAGASSLLGAVWSRLFGSDEYKIVMIGLDNAGKTTILYRLHLGDVIETSPTVGSNVEEVHHRNVKFQVWDLGGQDKLRRVWRTYYVGSHAVVLVVDSMDRERLGLLREELSQLTANEELRGAALLVLANKQDLQGAMSAVEITQALNLHTHKQHAWQIQPCSGVTGAGLAEGMDWLAHTLKQKR
jgi:ADP-ribosylation factor-like protein 5B